MIQFYFLTVVLELLGAAILLSDHLGSKFEIVIFTRRTFIENVNARIVLIVLTSIVGIMKLITPVDPGPVVVGDFFPALNLLALSAFYIFEIKRSQQEDEDEIEIDVEEETKSSSNDDSIEKVKTFYYTNKKIIGYTTLGIAFFHFLFPGAVLL
ncbi:MAG: hypothetical protein K9L24_02040 [Spirochaetia bacterium]|nr:hypothetical protein [Spirochaetia bacterium]MCF7946437.1 hypothetical protein [Spirochaetia bacterium]